MTLTIMPKIVLASGNAGKLKELGAMLSSVSSDIEVVSQKVLSVPEAEESGLSFVENAIIKARNACQHTGLPAIADDSGLEVDALQGEPGIYSARYAGVGASDQGNVEKLLQAMNSVDDASRAARFRCVIVYMRHARDPMPEVFYGTWEGSITREPSGAGGFGYDPVFFVPDHGKTAAELTPDEKRALSHRGQAMRKLLELFSTKPLPPTSPP